MLNLIKRFHSIDKGFYFHLFLLITFPIVFLIFDWTIAFIYTFIVALLHSVLLIFYPYINDSNYYKFLSLRKQFYENKQKYKLPFSLSYVLLAKWFLLLSFYWMFNYPYFSTILFPGQVLAVLVYTTNASVEIVNIVSRPRLPESVFNYHPLLQKRYGPVTDIVINKIIPVCTKTGGILISTYVGFVGVHKGFNGVNSIDPIRNYILNDVYQFPKTHRWTEAELSLWTEYSQTKAASSFDQKKKVEVFLQSKDFLRDELSKAITKASDFLDKTSS